MLKTIKHSIYFGASYKIAQAIDRIIPTQRIYCEKRHFNRELFDFAKLKSIPFNSVETKKDLNNDVFPNDSVGFSYGFGIIFTENQISKFTHGIWNIHTGKLPDLRGRHPISWAFIQGKFDFTLSIHQITPEIDQGFLLAQETIFRDLGDTEVEITKKMESALESGLIKKAIRNYASGKKTKLKAGTYYESLANKFAAISPSNHTGTELFNLFKAQAKYGGIMVGKKKYLHCTFYNPEYPSLYAGYDIHTCKDGVTVGLK